MLWLSKGQRKRIKVITEGLASHLTQFQKLRVTQIKTCSVSQP